MVGSQFPLCVCRRCLFIRPSRGPAVHISGPFCSLRAVDCCIFFSALRPILLPRAPTPFLQVIGGNTTATDAAYLSEYFHTEGIKTSVACVPCTISGGMKNNFVVSICLSISLPLCLSLNPPPRLSLSLFRLDKKVPGAPIPQARV